MTTRNICVESGEPLANTSGTGRTGANHRKGRPTATEGAVYTSQYSTDSVGAHGGRAEPSKLRQRNQERTEPSAPHRQNSTPELVKRQTSSRNGRHTSARSEYSDHYDTDPPCEAAAEFVEPEGERSREVTRTPRRQESRLDPNAPPRLLVVSSKIKNSVLMQTAVLPNVTFVQYKFETASLDNILSSISQHLGSKKVVSIALLVHSTISSVYISGRDDKTLTADSVSDNKPLQDFFQTMLQQHLDRSSAEVRLDFLACNMAHSDDGTLVTKELESILGIPVGISRDVTGSDIQLNKIVDDGSRSMYVGELYFRMERLRWSGNNQQSLSGFEKIRTVGKGAYGTAILYRKKDDDSLVILKEINLHDLTAAERQMALNEVRVLAMLDHPNIISYYDSFEEDGVVMIEMEYADGGTLAQFLSQQEKPLSEREILVMFAQIVSAIKCIHEHNVLHRDFKTANIFLTKEGRVKVGDFGISKLMSTANQGANTVLGTPYYISPEMCEGKPYNDKSDIWALGCILYEMACLQRTFEGSNLPALVNKIMKGQFAPVKGDYSQEFKNLIMNMLQREPEFRPSAAALWHHKLPELMNKFEEEHTTDYDEDSLNSSGNNTLTKKKKTRSVLYYFEMVQMQLTPIALPSRIKVRDVAVSNSHVTVVTMEQMVYTWGDGSKGQLGHGDLEPRNIPEIVEALKGKSIVKACSGSGFSIFASDNGIVMTCGDGTFGCLGHGDWCSTSRPRLIEALLSVDVACIACGPQHVVAVGSEGEVFTWGYGADGRLGLGNEANVCQPMEVSFEEPVCVRECYCGQDGTMLLTDVGSVMACGNNDYNKLGLNIRVGFLMAMKNIFNKSEVAGEKVFRSVKTLARHRVISIHMGPFHSAVIVEPGFLYTFGKNSEGQLGTGNTRAQGGPIEVRVFENKPAIHVRCGAHFTVTGTSDNDLLYWGTRYKKVVTKPDEVMESKKDLRIESASSSRSHSRQASTASVGSVSSVKDTSGDIAGALAKVNPETGEGRSGSSSQGHRFPDRQASTDSVFTSSSDVKNSSPGPTSGGFKPLGAGPTPRRTRTSSTSKDGKEDTEVILHPTPLIRMDSSGTHSQAGDTVTLSQFFCHGDNLFIQVETTAPPPKRRNRRKRSYMSRKRFSSGGLDVPEGVNGMSASSRDGGDEYSSEASELDSFGTRKRLLNQRLNMDTGGLDTTTLGSIPPWLKEELANSEVTDGHEPDDTSDHSEEGEARPDLESSMRSIRINRDMQQDSEQKKTGRMETGPGRTQQQKHSTLTPGHSVVSRRFLTGDSGIELPKADVLSSSSSSESMVTGHSQDVRNKSSVSMKKPHANEMSSKRLAPPAAGPTIVKSKGIPAQGQKPLNRIRAQGKTRRSDPKELAATRAEVVSDIKQKQDNIEQLMQELEQLRTEKMCTEQRLQKMEREHLQQREHIWKEAEKKSTERELQLQQEIQNMREDMRMQNHQLKDNFNVVLSLKAQLEKVQTEQARLTARDMPRPDSRQSQRESKICVVQ